MTAVCVCVCGQYKDTALHYAAKFGQLAAAVYIVEHADKQINALNDVRLTKAKSITLASSELAPNKLRTSFEQAPN